MKISNGLNKNINLASMFMILISMFFVFILPLKTFAIGQVTEPIVITNAQRGQEPQATLTIINNDKTETEIGLLAKGDIISWTKFYSAKNLSDPIQSIKMSAGSQVKIIARFSIPADARNGKYKGYVSVSKKFDNTALGKDQSSVSISQEIDREVAIEINGKEIIGFDVSVIPKTYDLKKDEPLAIRLIYDNSGNVAIAPQMQIKINNDGGVIYNTIYPYPENQPSVKPGEIYEIPEVQILTSNLGVGKYIAQMSFSMDGKIMQEKDFGFSVGMFAEPAAISNIENRSIFATVFDGFGGRMGNIWVLIILAGAIILFVLLKFKGRQLDINSAGIEDSKKNI